jgi:hypothetical protein
MVYIAIILVHVICCYYHRRYEPHFHSFNYQYCTFVLVKFSLLYVHAAALPKPDDIQGIIVSIPGLQNVYNLTASQIAMGDKSTVLIIKTMKMI